MRTSMLAAVILALVIAPTLLQAQEVVVRVGDTRETGSTSASQTYSYGFSYFQGFGENLAWSVGYLNEGHFPNHKRDGIDLQGWARINVLDRHLSLGVGAGPYLYWDTVLGTTKTVYTDEHGVGAIFSAAANWYTDSRFFYQAKLNYVVTANSIDTLSATIGIGYQLDKPTTPGPLTGPSPAPVQDLKDEITLFGGRTVDNSGQDSAAAVESLQYRRNLAPHFDWTIGWLNEHNSVSRTGPITEIWAGRTFLNDRFGMEIGFGPYLAYDSHGARNVTKLDWLAGISGNIRFTEHWLVRATWDRVTTGNDRDSDIFLAGVGYRF